MKFDLILKNSKIIDGTGNPWYYGEIAINEGKIVKIRPKIMDSASQEINSEKNVICPGFIDIHSHTDYVLPLLGKVESTIQQGITTQIVGMCGESLAPIHPEKVEGVRQFLTSVTPLYNEYEFAWNSFSEYLAFLEKVRCPANTASFVGYHNIRVAGGQGYENRSATKQEMDSMKEYLREAMEAGAFGMSTGLIYTPQVYASTEEIIELCKVVAEYNGLYFSHIRGEDKNIFNAIEEFIEIVDKSGVHAGEIAHFKVSGKEIWGRSKDTLNLIEQANTRGINISVDQYPYKRGMSNLSTCLPPWVLEGGRKKTLERLKDESLRNKIKYDILKGLEGWENWIGNVGFEGIYISIVNTEKWKNIRGKSIKEATQIKGLKDNWETLFQLLIDEKLDIAITIESMCDEDIERIMKNKYQMVGTDGVGIPPNPAFGAVHPRMFGTYPRFIAEYVRTKKILNLEQMIRKMTSYPAQKLGLNTRGLIQEGNWADLVVFDPEKIKDKATFDNPHQFPEGILYVLVNGEIVVDHGKQKRRYPGKILKRPL